MKADELREKYLSFFESKGHARRPSDVLVPTWDPSVLFTPAGMNQFKDHFLGKVKLDFTRATTSQKCLRTGDIENVGRTAYHHTFFEMLGNFSFGDYFKQEAILWAWEFLTSKKWLGLDPNRLTVSVYLDDDEAAGIWHERVGLPSSRIERLGESDNFWPASAPSQGPDGVCGPCSEIFFHDNSGEAVEIWNLVFTQFNRVGDPPDNLRPLPSKNIDTGMGLERAAAVLQGVTTNYHIDILRPIVEAAAEVCHSAYEPQSDTGRRLRRITDHVRACTFAIHENVYPGPQKEKYVIRRLLRRAVLDGHQMGRREPFLHQLVPVVVEMMKGPYPELLQSISRVQQVIRQEEQTFFATIDGGLARLERIFTDMEEDDRVMVDGQEAAELYTTYGLPPEVVQSLAAERNYTFDATGFRTAMDQHGLVSGQAQFELFKTGPIEALKAALHLTEFLGYEATEAEAEIKGIVAQGQLCDRVAEVGHEQPLIVVLDRSPFYGESGGQVGDTGEISGSDFTFRVTDTKKEGDLILHVGHLTRGQLRAGGKATARVDVQRRTAIRRAHSATHILHHALQQTLGSHAQQQGSKVDDDWLRFDFTNLSPVNAEQLATVEHEVSRHIQDSEPIRWEYLPLAEARQAGAMMLFGEKYPDPVRMVSMGQFSRELCGGTHLANTGEVECFEILSEEGVSAGTRRITAVTGGRARQHEQQTRAALRQAAELMGVAPLDLPGAVRELAQHVRGMKKELSGGAKAEAIAPRAAASADVSQLEYAAARQALRESARLLNVAAFDVPARITALQAEARDLERQLRELAGTGDLSAESLLEEAELVQGVRVIVRDLPGATPNLLRQLIDQVRKKSSEPTAVLLVARQGDDKVLLVAGVSRELVDRKLSAGDWVREVAPVVGGGGGGKPDMAQAGGKHPEKIPAACHTAREVIRQMLAR
ncbi:MAG: alanine--tRNA ligase [Pirellulaceae bacterium]|nr:alanine--tRNA ligase [Pirellulaceae bacterium]